MKASPFMLMVAVIACGCAPYRQPTYPPDVKACQSHDTAHYLGVGVTVAGALALVGSGIAYAASAPANTSAGTEGTLVSCSGGPGCSNGRNIAVASAAASLGLSLLGLALMEGETYSFASDGCGNAAPPPAPVAAPQSPPAAPSTTDEAPPPAKKKK
jgi:hypothetical protein